MTTTLPMNRRAALLLASCCTLVTACESASTATDAAAAIDARSDLPVDDLAAKDVAVDLGMDAGVDPPVDAPAVDVGRGDRPPPIAPDVPLGPPRCPGPFHPPSERELAVRRGLGIPDAAGCVVMFGQNSHLDIDWLYTFEQYYSRYVETILSGARRLLDADPAYRYSVAEMAFLAEHLRRHPEQAGSFRAAAARGALRVVGGGVTTPDTLLPTTEALARDYLRGSLYAESALGTRARAAWLPDSFGHAPTVPDALAAMGYRAVAFARVDGLHDAFESALGQDEIVPGSTAALLTEVGSADFVWRGPGGAEVLAHWMPYRLYCQGDNLDNSGTPIPGGYVTDRPRGDDVEYTNNRIGRYVGELTPYARTPYLFVPVGCDFQPPKAGLLPILRRWNDTQGAATGIYAMASTFEDYASLLDTRRDDLPRLSRDLTPYFTGYFGSRLALKRAIRRAGDLLTQAESASLLATSMTGASYPSSTLASTWDLFARSNHHDYVTGTSLDAVTTGEQMPWMEQAATSARDLTAGALASLASSLAPAPGAAASALVVGTVGARGPRTATVALTLGPGVREVGAAVPTQVIDSTRRPDGSLATATVLVVAPEVPPLGYRRIDFSDRASAGPVSVTESADAVTLRDASAGLAATIDRTTGLLRSLVLDGREWIRAPSLDVRAFDDQGGLYRIGSETDGCRFTPGELPEGATSVEVVERGPARAVVRVRHGAMTIALGVTAGTRRVDVDVDAAALRGQTYTLHLETAASGATGWFDQPAGVVSRPSQRLFDPTFWPMVRGVDLVRDDRSGFAVLSSVSSGVRYGTDGGLDVMISRNAYTERCDVLGASGTEAVHATLRFALRPHAAAIDLLAEALATLDAPATQVRGTAAAAESASLLGLDGAGFVVSAGKRAERGDGVIVRVQRTADGATLTATPGLLRATTFTRADLLERDDAPVAFPLSLDAPVVTLRAR